MTSDEPAAHGTISVEAATVCFALISSGYDTQTIDRAIKLALRGPDPIKAWLRGWLESQGQNVDLLLSGEPTACGSEAEVRELVEPALKRGAEIASIAQIVDIYLFRKDPNPDNIVYAFYIGARLFIARERKPTKDESKRIWKIALEIAKISKIGAPHWKELEDKSPTALNDWLAGIKENARKRFRTFLSQKKAAETSAESAIRSLMSLLFSDK